MFHPNFPSSTENQKQNKKITSNIYKSTCTYAKSFPHCKAMIPRTMYGSCSQSSCLVQSKGSQSWAKFVTAYFCASTDSCLWWQYMSSSGKHSIPLITSRSRLLLKCFFFFFLLSITWTNPLFRPNSTWKYGSLWGLNHTISSHLYQ